MALAKKVARAGNKSDQLKGASNATMSLHQTLLQYKLYPVPAPMVAANGEMATIKRYDSNEQVPFRNPIKTGFEVGRLRMCNPIVIHWPNRGIVRKFMGSFSS